MENIKLKVADLYELKARLEGFVNESGQVLFKGFVNEKVSESTRRIANKALRIIKTELEPIDKQYLNILNYKEEGKSEEELSKIRSEKINELMGDELIVQLERIDFKNVECLFEKGIIFEHNYSFLYEKLFINY